MAFHDGANCYSLQPLLAKKLLDVNHLGIVRGQDGNLLWPGGAIQRQLFCNPHLKAEQKDTEDLGCNPNLKFGQPNPWHKPCADMERGVP